MYRNLIHAVAYMYIYIPKSMLSDSPWGPNFDTRTVPGLLISIPVRLAGKKDQAESVEWMTAGLVGSPPPPAAPLTAPSQLFYL